MTAAIGFADRTGQSHGDGASRCDGARISGTKLRRGRCRSWRDSLSGMHDLPFAGQERRRAQASGRVRSPGRQSFGLRLLGGFEGFPYRLERDDARPMAYQSASSRQRQQDVFLPPHRQGSRRRDCFSQAKGGKRIIKCDRRYDRPTLTSCRRRCRGDGHCGRNLEAYGRRPSICGRFARDVSDLVIDWPTTETSEKNPVAWTGFSLTTGLRLCLIIAAFRYPDHSQTTCSCRRDCSWQMPASRGRSARPR